MLEIIKKRSLDKTNAKDLTKYDNFICPAKVISELNNRKLETIDDIYDENGYKQQELVITMHNNFVFSEGLAAVRCNKKWGFINEDGVEIIETKYDAVSNFKNGLARVFNNGKYGYINKEGKEIIEPIYEYMASFFDGMIIVSNDNKFGCINGSGKVIVDVIYDSVKRLETKLLLVKLNEKYGIIDSEGNKVLNVIYDNIEILKNGLLLISYEGKTALVTSNGKFIIPFVYDNLIYLDNGFILIFVNKRYGVINSSGDIVIKPSKKNYKKILKRLDKKLKNEVWCERHNKQSELILNSKQYGCKGSKEKQSVEKKYILFRNDNDSKVGIKLKDGSILLPAIFDRIEIVNEEKVIIDGFLYSFNKLFLKYTLIVVAQNKSYIKTFDTLDSLNKYVEKLGQEFNLRLEKINDSDNIKVKI